MLVIRLFIHSSHLERLLLQGHLELELVSFSSSVEAAVHSLVLAVLVVLDTEHYPSEIIQPLQLLLVQVLLLDLQ